MHNLELSHSELKTLKTIIMSDVIDSSMDVPDYSDAIDMFFYYERAKILEMINNQIGETT
jgi:hypothetical protein